MSINDVLVDFDSDKVASPELSMLIILLMVKALHFITILMVKMLKDLRLA
jgi:hypothetical protein